MIVFSNHLSSLYYQSH